MMAKWSFPLAQLFPITTLTTPHLTNPPTPPLTTLPQGISDKIDEAEKKELISLIDETLDWLEENPEAETEEFSGKQKEVEQVANPIMRKVRDVGIWSISLS